jgi:glycosyltransferase involved in cell wall biosynthesis
MVNNRSSDIDILLLCDNNVDFVGGGIVSIKIIMNGIKNDFSAALIQPGKVKNNNVLGKIYELSKYKRIKALVKNPFSFLKYIYDVYKIIRLNKPKIIHTQEQVSFFIVALLKKLKLINYDFKLIHTDRGLYTKYGSFIKKLFMFFIKELDILVTTTNFNMKYWQKAINEKYKNKEFRVIENTAGESFENLDYTKIKSLGHPIVIGFAGRYCDWKNWPLAEEICTKLATETDIDFKINMAVGCLDDASRIETEKMFTRLKGVLKDKFQGQINVKFEDMDQFYYDIDVFILTSNYNTESFGRTLVEAMSRKTVVLTTNAGGAVEVVGNTDNVCENADEFINRILYFYNNEEIYEKEKENNLIKVKKNYSQKNNIDKHLNMYRNILS